MGTQHVHWQKAAPLARERLHAAPERRMRRDVADPLAFDPDLARMLAQARRKLPSVADRHAAQAARAFVVSAVSIAMPAIHAGIAW